jgi:hypothetical protein
MGMHFGIVAARAAWPSFLQALTELAGGLVERGAVGDLERCDLEPTDAGFRVVGGEHAGCSYLLDTSMILSTGFDRLAALSRRLDCLVAACCAETVSGSFYWAHVEKGAVRRLYANCASELRRPYQFGEPLPYDAQVAFEDIDGQGLRWRLAQCGFAYDAWLERGRKIAYLYTFEDSAGPSPEGPFDKALRDHWGEQRLPRGEQLQVAVQVRRLPDGSIGYDIAPGSPPVPRRSLLAIVRGWFRR